ncbi:MAG TPA: ATP-binding protein [Polyangia bacterium]|jgi:signal transduction histidine kinase
MSDKDVDRSALELQALQRVIASGARALDLEVVLDRCLEQSMEVGRADAGIIYLRDPRRGNYTLAASRNTSTEFAPPSLDVDEQLERGHQLYDLSQGQHQGTADRARAAGFTHALVVVLVVEDRRVGFLALLFRGAPTLADSTTRTLEAIAAFEAVALESARVHQQVELRAQVARTLNDCAERLLDPDADVYTLILEAACKIARGSGGLLSMLRKRDGVEMSGIVHAVGDDVPLIGMELPITVPYLRESLAQHTPFIVEDVSKIDPNTDIGRVAHQQRTRSFILITMRQGDRPIGQLFVKSHEPRVYAEAEIEAIQLLSTMAAQALTRARRQAEERAEHVRTAAILEHLPVVVAVIDRSGEVVHINAAGRDFAQRMGAEDLSWRDALGSVTVTDRDGRVIPASESGVAMAFGGKTTAREVTLVTKLGEKLHVLSVTVPIRGADGGVESVLSSFQEVTELRELADAKDRFLSIASHELRSPITSLRATTSLLQLDPSAVADATRREVLLARIQRQIDRLSTLVERLLDTTRLNAGELPLDYADCDLAALCHDAAEHARLTDREHAYIVDAPQPIAGRWDAARIEQALTNLLSNACRYSPPQSEIVVRARADEARAVVEVIDRGAGIAPEQQQRLFTPFFRGAAAARHKGGLGLGLYITREIVRRHGGTMKVTSALGQGATFSFELPRQPQ